MLPCYISELQSREQSVLSVPAVKESVPQSSELQRASLQNTAELVDGQ
jgi:hypothetical protein